MGFLKIQERQNLPDIYDQIKLQKIKLLNDLAEQRGQTLAEMALAWLLKDNRVTSVIIGASSVTQLKDNLKALDNAEFTPDELCEIENILK